LNKSYLYSINPLQIEIKSLGSNILGCGIRDEKRILHIPTAYELDLGLDITDKIVYYHYHYHHYYLFFFFFFFFLINTNLYMVI